MENETIGKSAREGRLEVGWTEQMAGIIQVSGVTSS